VYLFRGVDARIVSRTRSRPGLFNPFADKDARVQAASRSRIATTSEDN